MFSSDWLEKWIFSGQPTEEALLFHAQPLQVPRALLAPALQAPQKRALLLQLLLQFLELRLRLPVALLQRLSLAAPALLFLFEGRALRLFLGARELELELQFLDALFLGRQLLFALRRLRLRLGRGPPLALQVPAHQFAFARGPLAAVLLLGQVPFQPPLRARLALQAAHVGHFGARLQVRVLGLVSPPAGAR